MNTATDHLESFKTAISTSGMIPPDAIEPGKTYRFSDDGGRNNNGWCRYFQNADGTAGGVFGSWRGDSQKWFSGNGNMPPETRKQLEAQIAEAKEKAEAERKTGQEKAAHKATFIYERSTPADPDHPYLKRKGIKAYDGVLQHKNLLVIPALDVDKKITSLQYIAPDGTKIFSKHGKLKGSFFWIKGDDTLALCEGYSTGASIFEATGHTVIIAFNAGNLQSVADQIRKKYPNKPLVICSDNDQFTTKPDGTPWNPGREKAISTAWALSLKIVVPSFVDVTSKPTDFNDLASLEGLEEARQQISDAKYPHEWLITESGNDPGAPFRPENVEGLKLLRNRDKSLFEQARTALKRLHIRVTELDADLNQSSKENSQTPGQLDIAHNVIQSYGEGNILFHQGFIWQYNGQGLWKRSDDRELKKRIHKEVGNDTSKNEVDSILDLTKTEIYKPGHLFDTDTKDINCLNCELHWTGSNWEQRAHVKEHFRITQLPVDYDPLASAPRFEQYLEECFHDDSDADDKALLVCEGLGYTLLSQTLFEKFFLLIGPGANGKSVLLDVIENLAGKDQICGIQPSQFGNRFQRAYLFGKLANVVTELSEGLEIPDGELKSIVSGEMTTVEFKHKDPFNIYPYATCWFASNHLPRTRDFSQAFFRRAIVIPFNRTFTDLDKDEYLKGKLRAELPGILNLALESMKGVFLRGHFTKTASSEAIVKDWRLESDQVQQFAIERCEFRPGLSITSNSLYDAYTEWAKGAGIKKSVNRNNFSARMIRLGASNGRGTGGVRVLCGVCLK